MNMNESATLYFSTFSGVTDKGNPRTIPAPKRAGMSKQEATISTLRHRAQLHGDRYIPAGLLRDHREPKPGASQRERAHPVR